MDYGQTTSALLAAQKDRLLRLVKAKEDELFALQGKLWRCNRQRKVLLAFLEEKGLLDQWQSDEVDGG